MKQAIAFLINGIMLLCNNCAAAANATPSNVYGNTVDRKCAGCGKAIPANRKLGQKF